MTSFLPVVAVGFLIGGSAAAFMIRREEIHVAVGYPHIKQRKDSGYATSFLEPERQEKETKDDETPDYSTTFPPSRRFILDPIRLHSRLWKFCSSAFRQQQDEMKVMLPMATCYHNADGSMVTACGFSVDDIKDLGNFPDYAKLSGVPLPTPYPEFNINKALPRPYRPFRWAYHQTMSLTKLEPDWWLELENTYENRIKQRQDLFEKHGTNVLQALPGSELACKELMEMVIQFLCARYPQYFALDKKNMVFHNAILCTKTQLQTVHPLHILLDNIPEDFAIMLRDEKTGYYRFRAGVICSALGWDVGTKIDLQLGEIHAPVPDYMDKMQFSMDRYFAKMPTDKPIQRGSWGLEVDQPLFMPAGDTHAEHRSQQMHDLELSRCHLRVDWQTLRRLPVSGAVAFNFKALFTPIEDFRYETCIPGLLLKILNEGKGNMMEYKNTWHTEHVVKPALEKFHQEQVSAGLVPEEWEPHTLSEAPWFPGWKEQWHRKMEAQSSPAESHRE